MRVRGLTLLWLALACGAAVSASARVGEKASELRQRFGKPEAQPQKNVLVWLVEEPAGALLYTVTLDEHEVSIAEGLKPFRQARLTEPTAQNFISEQLSFLREAGGARVVKPGEDYAFAGEKFTCSENEQVVVAEAEGLLVVWTKRPAPSVLAVTREMVARTRR